jgi:aspartokinase-like uncharacterized kinase
MKKQQQLDNTIRELSSAESALITGGGDFTNYVRCVSAAMTSGGGGALRTAALGLTIFGMARLLGVATGCATV